MGFLSIEDLEKIHSSIVAFCLSYDLKIDVITYCPHHPHKGYDGEVRMLKKDCFFESIISLMLPNIFKKLFKSL